MTCSRLNGAVMVSLQDYFAGLLVEQIKQQSQGQAPLKQTLQGVLANLQSLYQHNQLIFQVIAIVALLH